MFRTLLVATASLGAAGLNPPVTSRRCPTSSRSSARSPRPTPSSCRSPSSGRACCSSAGSLGDTDGRRGLLVGAIGVLCVANAFGLLVTTGPLFIGSRLASAAAAAAIPPFALALVATAYQSLARATAMGIALRGYAGATALRARSSSRRLARPARPGRPS